MNITIFFIIAAINTVYSTNDYHLPDSLDGMDYLRYYESSRTRFDQTVLKPKDFYASMLNPYYHRIPTFGIEYAVYERDMKALAEDYLRDIHHVYGYFEDYKPPTPEDKKRTLMPSEFLYLEPSHDYFEINLKYYQTQYTSYLLHLFGYKDGGLVRHIKKKYAELGYENSTGIKLQVVDGLRDDEGNNENEEEESSDDENTQEEEDEEKFTPDFIGQVKILSEREHEAVNFLMNAFPLYDNEIESYYREKIEEIKNVLVKYPFLNKDNKLLDPDKLTVDYLRKMAKRTLLISETYELYVLRMRRFGIVPLHLKLCQEEYGAFTDKPLIPDSSFFTEDTTNTEAD